MLKKMITISAIAFIVSGCAFDDSPEYRQYQLDAMQQQEAIKAAELQDKNQIPVEMRIRNQQRNMEIRSLPTNSNIYFR